MADQQAYELVVEQISALIEDKTLAIGDKLDGERSLAEQYQVSRTSVREAIRVLSALGIVESASGSGPSAGSRIISRPAAPKSSALRLHLAADSFDVTDVLESRVMLETWAYRKVHDPSSRALGEARGLVERMQATTSTEEYLELDAELHVRMVALAGNPLLTTLMSALSSSVAAYTARAAEAIVDWSGTTRTLDHEHLAIIDALSVSDGDTAATLVEKHIYDYARTGRLA